MTMRLGFKAAAHLAGALEVLHADVEPTTVFRRMSQAATIAVACEVACFDGFDEHNRMGHLGSFPQDLFTPENFATLVDCVQEHPLFDKLVTKQELAPLKITDFCPSSHFQRTTLYNEYYRPYSIINQLIVGINTPEHGFITCCINRHRRDFAEDDRAVFGLLKPHFVAAIRNARTVARLRQESPAPPPTAPSTGLVRVNSMGNL